MGLKKTEAKEYAKMLYLDTTQKLSNKEIAERVGVREGTIGRWIKEGEWDKLRKSLMVTRQKIITNWYDQIERLNDAITERDEPWPTGTEANTLAQLATNIKKLETETSIAEIFEVGTAFLDFLKPVDFDVYKKIIPVFDAFINSKLK
ncbi:MAG TPA: DDE transposase family protein [Xanthomarina gelatinilytica]|uniref:DDE transposase family protein n=1 Tax=Xanthomarina gelatinilytica TaxID=1137281 RepID=A0A3D6BUE9_9FLAO|nr:DDE transposase family protein [Xanthomarina gelatinilytica]